MPGTEHHQVHQGPTPPVPTGVTLTCLPLPRFTGLSGLLIVLAVLSLSACYDTRVITAHPGLFTDLTIGERLRATEDLEILEYDYLQIPLVKPGIQLVPAGQAALASPEMHATATGVVKKGDAMCVEGFVLEGGWIPCHGNWYLANPMVRISDGASAGRVVGISLVTNIDRTTGGSYEGCHAAYLSLGDHYLTRNDP